MGTYIGLNYRPTTQNQFHVTLKAIKFNDPFINPSYTRVYSQTSFNLILPGVQFLTRSTVQFSDYFSD
jgi:hypothetical protein